MNKINLSQVPVEETVSPKGRFRLSFQDIAQAMLGKRPPAGEHPHPFEVELVKLPPRAVNYPYHSHSAQWEFYLIVQGRGQMRSPDGLTEIREGDCLMLPPSEPHQLINTGASELVYYVIADNVASDVCYYPDSDKWALPGQSKPVRVKSGVDYYDGEE